MRVAKTRTLSRNFLNTQEAADFLSLSRRTLEGMRLDGTGPAYVKAGNGKRLIYDVKELLAWARSHTVREESGD